MVDLIIIKERNDMNYVTDEIMETLQVSAKVALEIQAIMDESDLDFSECSDFEFRMAMRQAFSQWMAES
jgi:hypothetical protein